MDADFCDENVTGAFKNGYIPDTDFIPRKSTACSVVVHGVKKNENPELTTMWVVLGYPPCSVAMPAWVKIGSNNAALLLRYGSDYNSKMCDISLVLKANVFDVERGHGGSYLHFSKVFNKDGTGYMQQLSPVENEVFNMLAQPVAKWREKNALNVAEATEIAKSVNDFVETQLESISM